MNITKASENALSVIVRVHDASERGITNLAACIFMIFGQKHTPTELVLCLQDFSESQILTVEKIAHSYPWRAANNFDPKIINVDSEGKRDIRSKLINEGFKKSAGRYLAILDYDDIIYGSAYTHLISGLQRSGSAIAFGGIKRVDVIPFNGFNYRVRKFDVFHGKDKFDMFYTNFCPIHSFVIDRHKISQEDLYFEEFLSKNEDYDFLLRILSKYESNFFTRNKFVGEYQVRTDGSNTIGSEYRSDPAADKEWELAIEHIHQLMKNLNVNVRMWDLHLLKAEAKNNRLPTAIQGLQLAEAAELRAEIANLEAKLDLSMAFLDASAASLKTINTDEYHGFLEELITQEDGSCNAKGWAADLKSKSAAKGVMLVAAGKVVATGLANYARPDVALYHDLREERCGFLINIPKNHFDSILSLQESLITYVILANNHVYKIGRVPGFGK